MRIELGDTLFKGKVTFEQDIVAKKDAEIEGYLKGSDYGNKFFVSSVTGSNVSHYGTTWQKPFASLEYAQNKCSAGDVIFALSGHNTPIAAAAGLDLDVAGITIIFLGNGTSHAKITFGTDAGADMDIDAANITLIRPKFAAAIDSLTGPIDVNATDFTMIDVEYHDATDVETLDAVIATSGATRLKIDGYKYFSATETGDLKQSHIQLNGCDDISLKNIDIRGDFAVGCVENVTDEVLNARLENFYLENLNATPQPALVLDANATGSCKNVNLKIASGSTYVSNVGKMSWDDRCEGFMGDGYAGEPLGTVLATGIEGKIDTIVADTRYIADNALPADPTADSLAAFLASGGTALGSELADSKSIIDAIGFDGSAFAAGGLGMYLPRCVAKTDGAVLNGDDDLFTITGGPIRAKITGIVTTLVGGAANGKLTITTTTPPATVDLNAGAVAIDNDAAGTSYRNVGATSVLTPVTAGMVLIDPVTVEDTELLLPIGTVKFNSSAAQDGVVAWYITYWPLSPASTVVAAA